MTKAIFFSDSHIFQFSNSTVRMTVKHAQLDNFEQRYRFRALSLDLEYSSGLEAPHSEIGIDEILAIWLSELASALSYNLHAHLHTLKEAFDTWQDLIDHKRVTQAGKGTVSANNSFTDTRNYKPCWYARKNFLV